MMDEDEAASHVPENSTMNNPQMSLLSSESSPTTATPTAPKATTDLNNQELLNPIDEKNAGGVDLIGFDHSLSNDGDWVVSSSSSSSGGSNKASIPAPDLLGLRNPPTNPDAADTANGGLSVDFSATKNGSNHMALVDPLEVGESSAPETAVSAKTPLEETQHDVDETTTTADNTTLDPTTTPTNATSTSTLRVGPWTSVAQVGTDNSTADQPVVATNDELPLNETINGNENKQLETVESGDSVTRLSPEATIQQLESELSLAKNLIAELQSKPNNDNTDDGVLTALQDHLQQQMTERAEAENKARLAEAKVANLQDETAQQAANLESLQTNLEQQMSARAEAEHKARVAYDRIQQLETEKEVNVNDLKDLQQKVWTLQQELASQKSGLEKARMERDEHERRAMALASELNLAKKKEAVKVNLAEEFEEDLKNALEELESVRAELQTTMSDKTEVELRLATAEATLKERVESFESTLQAERRLNEGRKAKMKEFVEKKLEELRQSKEENDSVQIELAQTNRSLVDLNNRWKQLHTQWVQAQTRNRELQRDLNRIKKDSETLHKQGDTLEMKLSRSANETEEHKNKRLAAKQELMSVLRTLDAERDVTSKLRDKIKFSFTPKVLSQHQMLHDILDEFETSLEKLSLRLGKPLPPASDDPEEDRTTADASSDSSLFRLAAGEGHAELAPLVEKLEYESQLVSQSIQAVYTNVGRLRTVVDASGDRTCFTVLSELVTTGGMASSPALRTGNEPTTSAAALAGALRSRSHGYGQIPGSADH